jgi:hypothetical protein
MAAGGTGEGPLQELHIWLRSAKIGPSTRNKRGVCVSTVSIVCSCDAPPTKSGRMRLKSHRRNRRVGVRESPFERFEYFGFVLPN